MAFVLLAGLAGALSAESTGPPWPAPGAGRPSAAAASALIQANDNRKPAGTLADRVLTLRLVAEQADWQPEGPSGRTLTVQAFREETGQLSIPSPLVRVPVGTEIQASIRNGIPGTTLRVFGLRGGSTPGGAALDIPAGETRETRFQAAAPGTYSYWATTTGARLPQRFGIDSQLGGALVVDPPGPQSQDRVFVIGLLTKSAGSLVGVGTINGRSWPFTETFDYRIGEDVRWRVVNLSLSQHAMHLHGMYFSVVSRGDGVVSRVYDASEQPRSVTEFLGIGGTFEMSWRPERPGNWLFHCHMHEHMAPDPESHPHGHHQGADASAGMAGLVVGVRVSGDASETKTAAAAPRRFTLRLREEPNRYGNQPGYRVEAEGIEASRLSPGPLPGPVLVLTRGEPVAIDLVNAMSDPTAIHWHGIELDSYFDGVPGWGGHRGSTTPPIVPGGTFTAKFTPPRAGTFIYHTHWHDEAQLSGGIYGALIVLEPGQRYDPATDHVFIAGYDGPQVPNAREPVVVNGRSVTVPATPAPNPLPLRPNVTNRLRLINITPNNVALTFALLEGFKPLTWKAVAKDGADLPPQQSTSREARQLVSVGETYDFEIQPTPGQRLWLELRRGNGEWVAQMLLVAAPEAAKD
jgi:FtsP/CotA-like multicopper oxidase with cupredoxin domain